MVLSEHRNRKHMPQGMRVTITVEGVSFNVKTDQPQWIATSTKTGRDCKIRFNALENDDSRFYCESMPGYYVSSNDAPTPDVQVPRSLLCWHCQRCFEYIL